MTVIVDVFPTEILLEEADKLIAVRATLDGCVTVIVHVAFTELATVDVAVIVAVPAVEPAVTKPLASTLAIFVLLDDQVTELAAPEGEAVTLS